MRRRADIDPRPFFRGRELPRLMTMIVMLALIAMLMVRARDPKMWAMLSGVSENPQLAGEPDVPPPEYDDPSPTAGPKSQPSAPPAVELPKVPGIDQDSEELESLQEEIQMVTDKEFLQNIEMPAYYRLLRWVTSQSVEELQRKAIKNPRFGDIFTRLDAYRGKLVDIRLHVRQVIKHKDLEKDNPAGITKLWELTGYNDSSGMNFFMCVTPELPRDMPVEKGMTESGRFVGYFFKLMAYEDRQGKHWAIPLIVGRFIWERPVLQKADPEAQDRDVRWGLFAIAAVGLVLCVRWGLRRMHAGKSGAATDMALREMRRRRSLGKNSDEETVDIDDWLDRRGDDAADEAINPLGPDDSDEERR